MSTYAYEAVNAAGINSSGSIDVANQSEAVRRIKEMGLFPTRVSERRAPRPKPRPPRAERPAISSTLRRNWFATRPKPATVAGLTRQMATLVDAGLPLLRGLRILEQQEAHPTLKRVLGDVGATIESGALFSEALAQHPRVFNRLYLNMVRAGETAGALEVALRRLAEFMEKAEKIKGKIKAALFYPVAVLFVATAVMALMLVFVIPKFKEVFAGLTNGAPLPGFTELVLNLSDLVRHHAPVTALGAGVIFSLFLLSLRTRLGRLAFDQFKLKMPLLGPVLRQSALSRFARTLGTLLQSGVPILQALQLVRDTAGNQVIARLVSRMHEGVKEGENLTLSLRTTTVFPPMIVGMVDVGEQTGALPDMLLKIADGCDEEVDNAVSALTSLLEPVMIVFLAVVVGSIVIAMFLPIIAIMTGPGIGSSDATDP